MASEAPPDSRDFKIEKPEVASGQCDCCGMATKRVWGVVHRDGEPVGAYFVSWTQGKPDHGAALDLILGRWGDSTTSDDRYSVALDLRLMDGVTQFMIVDGVGRAPARSSLVGTALKRSDVIGTPLAAQVFAIVDAIFSSDGASEVRHWSA